MTIDHEPGQEKKFVCAILPWLVAAAALAIYLLTLNHWVSLGSLGQMMRLGGLQWSPALLSPVLYLVTYPIAWLPEKSAPLALNLFAAVCGALTLLLLARSVALLPYDRTHSEREREHSGLSLLSLRSAWIPPVLAVIVCGLQLSFWESASAFWDNTATWVGSLFDLLLFAYTIRCLLEYRVSHKNSWLLRAALVYGAAMTESWLMVGLLPAFVVAVVWIKGLGFFDPRFLLRIFLCGLAGLLFYLVLPLAHQFTEGLFWEALKVNLRFEKQMLGALWNLPHNTHLLLIITSLLPVFVIGIRWASQFGDPSRLGTALTTWIFHLAHAALLGVCIWMAFDPVFSPRHLGLGMLSLYYLGALSVGYFSGYFLLVFQPLSRGGRRPHPFEVLLHRLSTAAVWLLLLLVPAGLVYKNLPQIRITNGPIVQRYIAEMTAGLPQHAILLGDDNAPLILAEAYLAQSGKAKNYVFVQTHSLKASVYHQVLQKKHPDVWPALPGAEKGPYLVEDYDLVKILMKLSEKIPVYYLHPSLGYYFEFFYPAPHGLVYELKRYGTNEIALPSLPDDIFAENDRFWKKAGEEAFPSVLSATTPPPSDQPPDFRRSFLQRLHVPFETNGVAALVGNWYSHSLNVWGVRAQRFGKLEAATEYFSKAHELNSENVIADINLDFNRKLRAGEHVSVEISPSMEDRLGQYRNWRQVVEENGPFDDPSFCYSMGEISARLNLYREAIHEFERVRELAPEYLPAKLSLARIYLLVLRMPDRALPLIEELNADAESFSAAQINSLELLQLELVARLANNQSDQVEQLVRKILARTKDPAALSSLAQICSNFGRYGLALTLVDRQLELTPGDPNVLVIKGVLNMQMSKYDQAVTSLNEVLTQNSTNYPALLDRAIIYLRTDRLDESRQDYELLQKSYPTAPAAYFGLGEIAFRRKDTNAAIQYYQLYLTNSPPNPEEAKFVSERLQSLKTGSH